MTEQTLPWTPYEDSTYCYPAVQNDEYYKAPQPTSSSLSSGSGSPIEMVNQRSPSPVDARTKNARAQARHRAKRKAYIENLETSVRQLRIAVTAGLSPQAQAQAQILERENARLRAEAQYLRSQLGASNGSLTAPMSSSWSGPSHGAMVGQAGNTDRAPGVRLPYIAGAMGPITTSTRTSPSPPSYTGHSRLRAAYSAENLRISGRSPENRRRRAPYAPVDGMRREVHRQSSSQSQQDFQYTPRQFHAQGADAGASLDGSPYQQSSHPSSYSSSAATEGFDQINTSTNPTYSYALKPDQQPHYEYQNQTQYEEQDDPTVYSDTAIVAPQAQPCYPPLSDYTATTFGLNGCAPQYTTAPEDIKPLVH
ncbi:hypothetical protein FRB95_007743 [Tulasnella sp. JGI-2019a]|nr:hypothetical protein FRB95_007743 [Tulasnella sp. JGI-2019a]